MALATTFSLLSAVSRTSRAGIACLAVGRAHAAIVTGATLALWLRLPHRQDIYNVLWAVVFGFATLNILSLAARRFEPGRRGLSFGELLAVMVVLISVLLLTWEMLNLFHIFPIQIRR